MEVNAFRGTLDAISRLERIGLLASPLRYPLGDLGSKLLDEFVRGEGTGGRLSDDDIKFALAYYTVKECLAQKPSLKSGVN
jgi:hypothetical protein